MEVIYLFVFWVSSYLQLVTVYNRLMLRIHCSVCIIFSYSIQSALIVVQVPHVCHMFLIMIHAKQRR